MWLSGINEQPLFFFNIGISATVPNYFEFSS